MTQKEKIEQEIERTLQSIDGITRAEANVFLFTRIKARMNRKSGIWENTFSFVSKPLVAVAVLALVMAMNGWSYFGNVYNKPATAEAYAENDSPGLPEFENEYKLITSTDSYDYENVNNE